MIAKTSVCLIRFFLFISTFNSVAQEISFQKSFHYSRLNEPAKIIVCKDQGYLMVGDVFNTLTLDWDFYAIKTKSDGVVLWRNKYGISKQNDNAKIVAELSDGNYIIGGITVYKNNLPLCLVKVNKDGKIILTKAFYGNDFMIQNIKEVKGEGFIVHGYYHRFNPERNGIVLMMLNQSLNITWKKTYENVEPGNVRGAFTITKDKSCILAYGNGGEYGNLSLIKTDNEGIIEWNKVYGDKEGINNLRVYDAETLSNGDFIISGNIKSQNSAPVLVKLNSEGELIWANRYFNFFTISEYVGINKNTNDEIVFCCKGKTKDKRSDAYLTKIDANGNVLWSKAYGTKVFEMPHDFKIVKDSSYIILASQRDSLVTDFYMVKTGFSGRIDCNEKDVQIAALPLNFSFLKNIKVIFGSESGATEVLLNFIQQDAGIDLDLCPPH